MFLVAVEVDTKEVGNIGITVYVSVVKSQAGVLIDVFLNACSQLQSLVFT